MKKITIAIDGPAGSGKTTTAKIVAERLGYIYIDTGAMYRAVTLAWLRSGHEMLEHEVCAMLDDITIDIQPTESGQMTLLNSEDVSEAIRTPEVTGKVSPISAMPCVREKLVEQQRRLGQGGGAVLDGRDIGTVVFPDAELKVFLIATIGARAARRAKEMSEKGMDFSIEEISRQIAERDQYDSSRSHSPLRKAIDAVEIDTSELTIAQQTEKIIELARDRMVE
ncbi:MAG: (d)CMP kinase [Candidatus Kapaibacterium sp.]